MIKKYGVEIVGLVAIISIVLMVFIVNNNFNIYTSDSKVNDYSNGNFITGNVIVDGDLSQKTKSEDNVEVDYIYNPQCGNGLIDYGEQCDDGDFDDSDACVNCMEARCGDGYLWLGVEQCETTTTQGKSCESYGYDYGELGCNDCGFDTSTCY